jgi:hypothetical protein
VDGNQPPRRDAETQNTGPAPTATNGRTRFTAAKPGDREPKRPRGGSGREAEAATRRKRLRSRSGHEAEAVAKPNRPQSRTGRKAEAAAKLKRPQS